MAVKTPVKATFTGSDVTGLAEYQAADFIGVADGGTGAVTFSAGILTADGTNAFTTVTAPTGDIVGTSDTQTLTNKTIDASNNTISNIGVSSLTTSSFTLVDDSSTSTTITLGETLQLLGGTGISSTVSGDSVTFAIDNTVVTTTGSQTLTNKTLTSPVISTISNTGTLTLPTSTDTLVGRDTTDTLTNKTIDSANNTITITESDISDLGSYITASSTDTLTNKTINASQLVDGSVTNAKLANSSISIADDSSTSSTLSLGETLQILGGTGVSSTVSGDSVTLAIDNTVTTNSGTQTLTNKTIDASSNTLSNIGNSSLTNSSITVTDGTTSTATSLGGTITFSGTNNEIEVSESSGTLTFGLPNDVTVGGALTVTGNLTVNGTTTTVNSTNTTLDDNLLELNSGAASNANDSGIIIERGSTGDNAIFAWDESADKFTLGTTTATASDTGNLTISTGTLVANLEGDVTGNADTATALETARTIAGQSFDGSADITIASTDLSDTSSITLNSATQTLTNKTINSASNTITITESDISDLGSYITASSTDTLTNKTINSASNTITITESDISDLQSYILADSTDTLTNKTINSASNTITITESNISDLQSYILAGSTDTLTNKTIDASNNTITNIGDSELSSGINATKIADGTVSNTEFQHLNGVSSNIQTQLDAKATNAFAIAQAVALG